MVTLHGCLSSAHVILFLPTMCVGRSVSRNLASFGIRWSVPAQKQVTPLFCADQTPAFHLLYGSSLTLNCSRLHHLIQQRTLSLQPLYLWFLLKCAVDRHRAGDDHVLSEEARCGGCAMLSSNHLPFSLFHCDFPAQRFPLATFPSSDSFPACSVADFLSA